MLSIVKPTEKGFKLFTHQPYRPPLMVIVAAKYCFFKISIRGGIFRPSTALEYS